MNNALESIQETLLMGPGPSCVQPQVYKALSRPTIGHLDPKFIEIMDEIKLFLQKIMQTKNQLTIPISGTGSAGMETCFVNLVEPGDEVLILINGVFGKRMEDLAQRLGAKVDTLEFEWGTPVMPELVKEKLDKKNYKLVAIVHAETSTGVCNPVSDIADLLRDKDALFLVDTVTSLGGIPVEVDNWQADAIYSGTQKCLSCPPGLAPITFSDKAVQKTLNRKSKVPNWYLDLSMIANYWEGNTRAYHHTAPINMLYALYEALYRILEEGMDNVFERHQQNHTELVKSLESMGLEMLVKSEYRLPMLNSVRIPDNIDEALVRKKLLVDHQIEIGAGLGPLAGKIWRIGLMGHTARSENVERFADALATCISG
ncbi:MAG: alanine--glyoxylate aminotransferase family protein [Proteobacteria bacterium]|nr:alanine--glyoxylate aminotransferase family protein [Pseudomonadota bacterium]